MLPDIVMSVTLDFFGFLKWIMSQIQMTTERYEDNFRDFQLVL